MILVLDLLLLMENWVYAIWLQVGQKRKSWDKAIPIVMDNLPWKIVLIASPALTISKLSVGGVHLSIIN